MKNNDVKKAIIGLFVLIIIFFGVSSYFKVPQLKINNLTINLLTAKTPYALEKGLGGRSGLLENQGMLFIYEKTGNYSFWMKGMRFPIDIIWLDEGLRIVAMKEHATPDSYPEVFDPRLESRYTLEVIDGFVDKNQLKIGYVFEKNNF
ncbi:MAG: DUF192 domain-containing protein [Candidatus Taylorbacteria bacterium]|nr:DUF192 domain-containing protein [Candidatus Taylorbacteria bacterium]